MAEYGVEYVAGPSVVVEQTGRREGDIVGTIKCGAQVSTVASQTRLEVGLKLLKGKPCSMKSTYLETNNFEVRGS